MTVYRILKAEGKSPMVIKKGFCWPVVIAGPVWACYKRFWPAVLVITGVIVGLRFGIRGAVDSGLPIVADALFVAHAVFLYLLGRNANLLLTSYVVSRGYKITDYVQVDSLDAARDIAKGVVRPSPEKK